MMDLLILTDDILYGNTTFIITILISTATVKQVHFNAEPLKIAPKDRNF
jgi:hypothetical protein